MLSEILFETSPILPIHYDDLLFSGHTVCSHISI